MDWFRSLFAADEVGVVPDAVGALLTGAAVFAGLLVLRRLAVLFVGRLAGHTRFRVDDHLVRALERTNPLVLAAIAAWLAADLWLPDGPIARWTGRAAVLAALFQVGAWASLLVQGVSTMRRDAAVAAGATADATAWTAISFFARLVLWALLGLVALDNLGVDVTALVAGLGIGGLAIGLAVQSVLGDVFASLAIVLDRPFAIGDFLVVGDVVGTVEHVGLKTTRVRALSGEQIVVSNADLLGSRIRNYKRMERRRVVFGFGVEHGTPPELLERVPQVVREIVDGQPGARFDRAHLCRLGESAFDYEVVYIFEDPDYNRHMDAQQAVLLAILRRLGELGVRLAHPTRTLHVHTAAATAHVGRNGTTRAEA